MEKNQSVIECKLDDQEQLLPSFPFDVDLDSIDLELPFLSLTKTYPCDQCPKTFQTWKEFRTHLYTHSKTAYPNVQPRKKCEKSKKRHRSGSSQSNNCDQNVTNLTQVARRLRPFRCVKCNQRFALKSTLMNHEFTRCLYPACRGKTHKTQK